MVVVAVVDLPDSVRPARRRRHEFFNRPACTHGRPTPKRRQLLVFVIYMYMSSRSAFTATTSRYNSMVSVRRAAIMMASISRAVNLDALTFARARSPSLCSGTRRFLLVGVFTPPHCGWCAPNERRCRNVSEWHRSFYAGRRGDLGELNCCRDASRCISAAFSALSRTNGSIGDSIDAAGISPLRTEMACNSIY